MNQDKQNESYQFGFYINFKTLKDYLEVKGLTVGSLNFTDINFASYFVNLALTNTSKTKIIEGETYYYVMNNFIKKNLVFVSFGDRQIGNILKKLEDLQIIKRVCETRTERYIKVNSWIVERWRVNEVNNVTPTQRLRKSAKKYLWETVENEFGSYEDFDRWIIYFDTHIDRQKKETLYEMGESLYHYCKACQSKLRKVKRN